MINAPLQRLVLASVFFALTSCGSADPSAYQPALGISGADASVPSQISKTSHYAITSTAGDATTHRAGLAVEALFDSYLEFFNDFAVADAAPGLRIRLYGTRPEFLANNRSRPWAEAYYAQGVCHAYLDPTKPNPYHWLLHEAVHQLNRELAGIAKEKWINEGLATYFGSSRYADGRLHLGVPDLDAYPLWWLERWELAGDWTADVRSHHVIPLRNLITGEGEPSLDASVNAHYLGWWSLTQFLLHYDGGRYAAGYRHLVEHGGSLAEFERFIGPLEKIEAEWYAHFRHLALSRPDSSN